MNLIFKLSRAVIDLLDDVGAYVSMLPLRLLLAWEFCVNQGQATFFYPLFSTF